MISCHIHTEGSRVSRGSTALGLEQAMGVRLPSTERRVPVNAGSPLGAFGAWWLGIPGSTTLGLDRVWWQGTSQAGEECTRVAAVEGRLGRDGAPALNTGMRLGGV
jgi:hypothetical protein